jgi:ABC-type multidrug transport system fused ATPase/permease subunit
MAIALALYREPDVLVFDEATSALDYQTEHAVIGAIEDLHGVKTLVLVARLSTVRDDRLVFLEDWRVIGKGRPLRRPCRRASWSGCSAGSCRCPT